MNKIKNSNQFRPTRARIDLDALAHNFALARDLAGPELGLLGVVKANAYGHGAVSVAKTLEAQGVGALGVATPREGLELREAGIKAPIFLLAGPFSAPGDLLVEYGLTPFIFNRAQMAHLEKTLSKPLEFHLKVDTGMTRLGILPDQIPDFLKDLKNYPHLSLKGVLSHLAQADETFAGPTASQYEIFAQTEAILKKEIPGVEFFHIANSAAILGKQLGPCNWARPGLMLYGANPHPRLEEGKKLKPVMHLETQILSLKEVPAGAAVSYGGDWVASRKSRIAVLPVGYADGYHRSLGNRAEVLIDGKRVPVVGRVCMDLSMIDVTDFPEVDLGSTVTLWGPGLPAEEVADWAGTISYELFCGVSPRVPRIYEGEGH